MTIKPTYQELEQKLLKQQRVSEKLRDALELNRKIISHSPIGIGIYDETGQCTEANQSYQDMIGATREQTLAQNFYHIDSWKKSGFLDAAIKALKENKVQHLTRRVVSTFGRDLGITVFFTPFVKEGKSCLMVMATDVRDRLIMEEALQQSESTAKQYLDIAGVVIVALDRLGNIQLINQTGLKILGYDKQIQLMGRNWFKTCLPERLQTKVFEVFEKLMEGRVEPVEFYENQVLRKDGEERTIAWRNTLVRDSNQEIIGSLSSGEDITDRKRTEEALIKSNEKLQRYKRMESLGLLAGGVAHDLNNILSGIVGYPDLILEELDQDSKMRTPLEIIRSSGIRATEVVADLLTIARGVAITKKTLNPNTLVKEYLSSAEHKKLKNRYPSIVFIQDLDPNILNISCSSTHIQKTLMNLMINGAEAIEGESGIIRLSTGNCYLDEPLTGYEDIRIGEYVVIRVEDSGVGIGEEDIARIFEPFYTKKILGRSGTGLGLAVVWNTIQDHEGYINVNSSPKGSVFDLYLPVSREEIVSEKTTKDLRDYQGQGQMILVVDDEKTQRFITCEYLKKLNYKHHAVSSGEEALEFLKERRAELIVLDMIMPKGMNGRETYEKMVQTNPRQKAIIASGFTQSEEVRLAQKLGAGVYIKKPYTLEILGKAIRDELARAPAGRT